MTPARTSLPRRDPSQAGPLGTGGSDGGGRFSGLDEAGRSPQSALEGGGGHEDGTVVGGVFDAEGGGEILCEAGTVGPDGAHQGGGFGVALAAAVPAKAEAGEGVGGGDGGQDGVAGSDSAGFVVVAGRGQFGLVEVGPGQSCLAGRLGGAARRPAGSAAPPGRGAGRRAGRRGAPRGHS